MIQISAYLTFDGNCREAMGFYKDCIGGELTFQTIGESPICESMPLRMKACILHATLNGETLTLMASDMVPEHGLVKGNAVSLAVNCNSREETERLYSKLSSGGGKATHPLAETQWGAIFGDLTDKYGNNWLLHFDQNNTH